MVGALQASQIAAAIMTAAISAGDAQASEQTFIAVIKNVTADDTLKLPDGKSSRAPIAPGIFAVINDGVVLFDPGKPADRNGIEALAEDGNAEMLIATLKGMKGVREAGMFIPGQAFEVIAEPGDRLVFAAMFVQSNDKFYAPDPNGIALFDSMAAPLSGDWTSSIKLWDAGTEKDEVPGLGASQAPRQPQPNTGPAEGGSVRVASDGFQYPPPSDVIRVIVSAK